MDFPKEEFCRDIFRKIEMKFIFNIWMFVMLFLILSLYFSSKDNFVLSLLGFCCGFVLALIIEELKK